MRRVKFVRQLRHSKADIPCHLCGEDVSPADGKVVWLPEGGFATVHRFCEPAFIGFINAISKEEVQVDEGRR